MMLPPTGTTAPVSDAKKQWVDNPAKALAARPPEDPLVREALRLAHLAAHQPCTTAEWTAATAAFIGSSAGVVGTSIGTPTGPGDWVLLFAAISGFLESGAGLVNCAIK